MSDPAEKELGRRLRSIDHPLPFDAEAFTRRVVAERSRRKKRRATARCVVVVLSVTTIGLAWHYRHRTEIQPIAGDQNIPDEDGLPVTVTVSPQRIEEIDALLARLDDRQQHLDMLADQVAESKAALAAAQEEQQEQMLAFLRAELSDRIEVEDLTRLYVEATGSPAR